MDVGVEFSHYRVIEHIGRGGMADVWSARDKRLSRTVAIKTIARDLTGDIDPVRLFEREARTIANLEHPHILPIYEFGEYDGQLYIVMRYVSGGSLDDLLERGPLSLEETLRVCRAVGQALEYAHRSGVIHLDLKPSNVLLDSYQSPYLADFGLAAIVGPEGRAQNPGSGTLLYMAPEQLTSDQLDLRADIYSFAILVFHMLIGQLPFDGSMPLALMQLQMREDLPEVHRLRPGIPSALTAVLRRASAVEPIQRPASMKDLLEQLEAVTAPGRTAPGPDAAARPVGERASAGTGPLEHLLTGPVDQLISRTDAKAAASAEPASPDRETETGVPLVRDYGDLLEDTGDLLRAAEIDRELISRVSDEPLSRPGAAPPPDDRLISRRISEAQTEEIDASRAGKPLTEIKIDLTGLDVEVLTPEQMARREIEDIYQRARRAWARGQGRFLLGVTDYILIADAYAQAEANSLTLDDQGREMLLRGALEYDHEVDFWWAALADDDRRRWVALHALRSENAPARVRALERLAAVKDAQPPQIPRLVAQALQVEASEAAQIAAIHVLERRAPLQPTYVLPSASDRTTLRGISAALKLAPVSDWRDHVYSPEIDGLLASLALNSGAPAVAESAARAIGRIRSIAAVNALVASGGAAARRALALVRDEAPSLPASVPASTRLYAWWTNTLRRLGERPVGAVWRYIFAFIGGAIPTAAYVWINLSGGIGTSIVVQEIYERMVGLGLLFGLLFGFTVTLASELPARLFGFWTWWARALLGALFGGLGMTLAWGLYNFLLLRDPYPVWEVMAYAGIGAAAAFAIQAVFRLPGIVMTAITFLGLYLPLFYVWHVYYNDFTLPVSIVYFRDYAEVFTLLIPMMLWMAAFASLARLVGDLRWLRRRWLRR
jgi:serine/threonine-protein kinase